MEIRSLSEAKQIIEDQHLKIDKLIQIFDILENGEKKMEKLFANDYALARVQAVETFRAIKAEWLKGKHFKDLAKLLL
jgi:hypothetical protein